MSAILSTPSHILEQHGMHYTPHIRSDQKYCPNKRNTNGKKRSNNPQNMSPIKNKNIVTNSHSYASDIMDIQRLDMNIRTRSDDIYQHQPENTTLYGSHMIPIEYSYNHIFGEATNVIKSVCFTKTQSTHQNRVVGFMLPWLRCNLRRFSS